MVDFNDINQESMAANTMKIAALQPYLKILEKYLLENFKNQKELGIEAIETTITGDTLEIVPLIRPVLYFSPIKDWIKDEPFIIELNFSGNKTLKYRIRRTFTGSSYLNGGDVFVWLVRTLFEKGGLMINNNDTATFKKLNLKDIVIEINPGLQRTFWRYTDSHLSWPIYNEISKKIRMFCVVS